MSFRIFLPALLVVSTAGLCRADDPLPIAPPASKYARMAAHSPFAPPTAPTVPQATPPPPPVPGWADALTATMIMRDGDRFMVTVVDPQSTQHLYLTSEPDKITQMAVASVKWGANPDDPPTVTLSKGKEFAQVKFESGAASPGGNNALGGSQSNPGAPRGQPSGGPPIPGSQAIHLPPPQNVGQRAGAPAPASPMRRPPIQGPSSAVNPGAGRPALARPNPGVKVDEDDDDD